jgi:glutathione peroxidase-family protein
VLLLTSDFFQWNFEKFLIDKQGNVVNRWASTTTPAAIDAEIAKLVEQ